MRSIWEMAENEMRSARLTVVEVGIDTAPDGSAIALSVGILQGCPFMP